MHKYRWCMSYGVYKDDNLVLHHCDMSRPCLLPCRIDLEGLDYFWICGLFMRYLYKMWTLGSHNPHCRSILVLYTRQKKGFKDCCDNFSRDTHTAGSHTWQWYGNSWNDQLFTPTPGWPHQSKVLSKFPLSHFVTLFSFSHKIMSLCGSCIMRVMSY